MFNRKKIFSYLSLVILVSCFQAGWAHQPDLSSLMIYEQNGKSILLIKSSLTAFEGEIDYLFHKDSYKTPLEFQKLVIRHFQKNCFVIINGDTIKLTNPQVILGHETTVFAELSNRPKAIKSIYIKNTMFKDMPNNMCEVILTMNNLPQKQFILGSSLNNQAKLNVENRKWIMQKSEADLYKSPAFIVLGIFLIIGLFVTIKSVIKFESSISFGYLLSPLLKHRR